MPIDGCKSTFRELVRDELPQLLSKLKTELRTARPAKLFVTYKSDKAML